MTLNVSICSAYVNTQRHMFVHVVAMPGLPVSTPEHLRRPSSLSCYFPLLVMWIRYTIACFVQTSFVIIMSEMHMWHILKAVLTKQRFQFAWQTQTYIMCETGYTVHRKKNYWAKVRHTVQVIVFYWLDRHRTDCKLRFYTIFGESCSFMVSFFY